MYALTVLALIGVISNNVVEWYEALILILMFGAYIVVLYFNTQIEYLALLQVEALRNRWFPGTVGPNPTKANGKSVVEESTPLLGGVDEEAPAEHRSRRDSAMSAGEERLRRDSVLLTGSVCKIVEQEEHESLWSMPDEGSVTQILWVLFWPARLLLHLTVPDCRRPSMRKWFPLTFTLSVVWIGAVSYVTVWMVTIIGFTLGIPDSVAGITLLAAGTSIPEVFSSVIVARSGLAPAMTYTSVTLLSTVVLLFVIFVLTRWTLNYKVGFACVVMYVIFITLACMYELNVFGDFNPPTCT
ncbi:hypothetical protein MRX96_014101 [Rhipicephalus microplus]